MCVVVFGAASVPLWEGWSVTKYSKGPAARGRAGAWGCSQWSGWAVGRAAARRTPKRPAVGAARPACVAYPPVTAAEPLSSLQVSALTTALHPHPPASPCAADDDESEAEEEEEEEEEAPKPKGKGKGKKAGGKQAAEEVQLGGWRYRWVGGAAGQVAVPLGGWLAGGEAWELFGFGRQRARRRAASRRGGSQAG